MPVATDPVIYEVSRRSIEPVLIDFTDSLPAGRSVASVSAWVVDPDRLGSAVSSGNIALASPSVTITVGPFATLGTYYLNVLATCSGAAPVPKLGVRITIKVLWDDPRG